MEGKISFSKFIYIWTNFFEFFDSKLRTPLHLAKSKLKILQDCTGYNSDELKEEAKHIIEMMQIYLTKSGKTEKLIVLNQFINRLKLHDKKEDVRLCYIY